MASFRRSLSPSLCHERSLTLLQNGALSLPDRSGGVAAFHEVVMPSLCPLRRPSVLEKPAAAKLKGGGQQQSWKRPFLHTILCFFLGFLIGLSPLSWPGERLGLRRQRGLYIYDTSVKELQGIRDDLHTLSTVRAESAMHALSTANSATNSASNSAEFAFKSATNSTLDSATNSALDSASDSAANSAPNSASSSVASNSGSSPGPLLIVITPTYNRASQALCLTRLSQTLRLVPPPLLWLVVESGEQSMETAALLRKTGVMYRHLVSEYNATSGATRGVHQRNVALAHIEQHQLDGIVYFADDDNVYTLELFKHMRKIRRFGTWPVGMLTHDKAKAILEGPVCDGEKVIGWHTNEKSKRLRRFHVDMSGFAFNSTILWDPLRWGRHTLEPIRQLDNIKEGFQETTFIEQVVEDESQMEGLPSGCSRVMIWHLHLDQEGEATPHLAYPAGWSLQQSLNVTMPLRHF